MARSLDLPTTPAALALMIAALHERSEGVTRALIQTNGNKQAALALLLKKG